MTDTQDQETTIAASISEYIRALLRHNLADERARQERIRELEGSGHRIISGGQTGRLDDGQATWEITDWRTGEPIESGTGNYEAYEVAANRLDPDGKWIHVEHISEGDDSEAGTPQVEPAGVPASLAEALQDWLGMTATPDEDVAAIVGWSVEEVSRHREYA